QRNAAHGDAELVLDLLLDFHVAAEVCQREAAVDRRRCVLWNLRRREPSVELVLGVDATRVLLAKILGACVEIVLDRLQRRCDRGDELSARDALLVLRGAIATAGAQSAL